MRALVTGVAGLIGSHLAEALLARGDTVVGVDNFLTGRPENLVALRSHDDFSFLEADICAPGALDPIDSIDSIDVMFHLASPASPTDFYVKPIEILRVGSTGTFAAIELAQRCGARLVFASTSEVYGEPHVHPQPEEYWGNVSSTGPRACYDEAKRFSEAALTTYARSEGLDIGIARIFNTYGPHMRHDDGRVVSNFVTQALAGEPLTINGDGGQTRSFCYVDDLVAGLIALAISDEQGPINLGNPDEVTVAELARVVLELTGSSSTLTHRPMPTDDPSRRQPDITVAREKLGFEPAVTLEEGIGRTVDFFRNEQLHSRTHGTRA